MTRTADALNVADFNEGVIVSPDSNSPQYVRVTVYNTGFNVGIKNTSKIPLSVIVYKGL